MQANQKTPAIHEEFPKTRGWPEGIDATFARKVLYRAFLNAAKSPWSITLAMREGTFKATYEQMIKRWHGTANFVYIL